MTSSTVDSSLLNVCPMINLHSFRKSGSSISAAMCSVVGKNPGGGGGGGVVKPTPASLGPQAEAKRLTRRSDAEAERDPESDNGDVGSEGSSSKGDKGRHALDWLERLLQNCVLGEDVLLLLPSCSKATDFEHYV